MNIQIGIDNDTTEEKLHKLISAGADEFFCGIVPEAWSKIYGYAVSPNRRYSSENQITSFEKLNNITSVIHNAGKKIAVAINEHYYSAEQLPLIKKILVELRNIGVDNLIVADIAVLSSLDDTFSDFGLHISGEAGIYNTSAVELLKKFCVTRVILPRDVTLSELEDLIKNTNAFGFEYEVFLMADRCIFSASYCHTLHGFGKNFCGHFWQKRLFRRLPLKDNLSSYDKGQLCPDFNLLKRWYANMNKYYMWAGEAIYPCLDKNCLKIRICGLCAIPELKRMGVHTLKIIGRGTSFGVKLHRVQMAKKALDNVSSGKEYFKGLMNQPEICESGYMCYYPEARI